VLGQNVTEPNPAPSSPASEEEEEKKKKKKKGCLHQIFTPELLQRLVTANRGVH